LGFLSFGGLASCNCASASPFAGSTSASACPPFIAGAGDESQPVSFGGSTAVIGELGTNAGAAARGFPRVVTPPPRRTAAAPRPRPPRVAGGDALAGVDEVSLAPTSRMAIVSLVSCSTPQPVSLVASMGSEGGAGVEVGGGCWAVELVTDAGLDAFEEEEGGLEALDEDEGERLDGKFGLAPLTRSTAFCGALWAGVSPHPVSLSPQPISFAGSAGIELVELALEGDEVETAAELEALCAPSASFAASVGCEVAGWASALVGSWSPSRGALEAAEGASSAASPQPVSFSGASLDMVQAATAGMWASGARSYEIVTSVEI
jgi:hypothetical protein